MKRTTIIIAAVSVAGIGAGIIYGLNHKPLLPQSTTSVQTQQTPASQNFDKKQYSISDPASQWIVVNKQRPLDPKTYSPSDLTAVGNGQNLRMTAADAYKQLVAGAKAAGYTLVPESGYRSYVTQVSVYGNEVKNYGQAVADSESARPGYSEHQTGWAVDIATPGCREDCFGSTDAAKWVLAQAADYGYIRRYVPDKSAITGYRTEPWHFRYVGKALAAELSRTGQTLEEFFDLPSAPNY
ncbi:MAG TPA: M15 family metallopeptidase [Candidatus Saccharimonadales bacterium]|nr:M15 family metallopeptidase [Candidatus Saccharimonadales bacterium]